MHAVERTEQRFDLCSRQYDRETLRPLGPNHILQPAEVLAKDVAGQKHQRTERLILRRGADPPVYCNAERNRVISSSPISKGSKGIPHLQGLAVRVATRLSVVTGGIHEGLSRQEHGADTPIFTG